MIMDTLQVFIDSISKIAFIPQSISQGISPQPQPIVCLDVLYKLGVVLIALFNFIFSIYLYKTNKINQKIKDTKINRQNLLNTLILNHKLDDFYKIFACIHTECKTLLDTKIDEEQRKEQTNGKLEELFIRLNLEFITTLRAVDIKLSNEILFISDTLQSKLSENIFDNGVNLHVRDKYDELIQTPISDAEIEILKRLYEFS